MLAPPLLTPAPQGPDAIAFIESLVVGDIAGLQSGTGTLSVLLNERGGVIDDLVITKARLRVRPLPVALARPVVSRWCARLAPSTCIWC